jgi:Txe/YoeB family toxin of Txe-Axe toxin-antitoxin module
LSSQFKEDMGWWFKKDPKKAAKILDLVTAVMQDPYFIMNRKMLIEILRDNT